MVRDAVAEALEQAHALGQISANDRAMREGVAKVLSPQLLVSLAEQACPEAERDAGDDAASCDRFPSVKALDGDDDLFDTVGLKDAEVHQPGLAERVLRLAITEHGINRVPGEHLEVMDHAETRGGQLGVPVVERERALVIPAGLVDERLEAG